jgi:hypothetical protein
MPQYRYRFYAIVKEIKEAIVRIKTGMATIFRLFD